MKRCPACATTYTDETLSFCLADGTPLSDSSEEQTVVRNATSDPMRVVIPQDPPRSCAPVAELQQSSNAMKILLVVGLLGAMIIIAVTGAAALIYYNKDSRSVAANNSIKPTPVVSATLDQTNTLRDQIANLEKRLKEQKKTSANADLPLTMSDLPSTTRTTAQVNSPGDGFLALRTLPNSEAGERIAKIPHGANVSIGVCGPVVKPVNRSGRWCQASYSGQSGWVFDAYLNY